MNVGPTVPNWTPQFPSEACVPGNMTTSMVMLVVVLAAAVATESAADRFAHGNRHVPHDVPPGAPDDDDVARGETNVMFALLPTLIGRIGPRDRSERTMAVVTDVMRNVRAAAADMVVFTVTTS